MCDCEDEVDVEAINRAGLGDIYKLGDSLRNLCINYVDMIDTVNKLQAERDNYKPTLDYTIGRNRDLENHINQIANDRQRKIEMVDRLVAELKALKKE